MEELYGEHWKLVLLIGFLITWGIGLIPPLLIRFLILRRPLSRGWAIGVVVLFWIFNFVLFTAMGSQSRTHGALFLVAFVSYYILVKGAKRITSATPSDNDSGYNKVARMEVQLGKQKPEIADQAQKAVGFDTERFDEEYLRLRVQDLKNQGSVSRSATSHTASPRPATGEPTERPARTPPNWITYSIVMAIFAVFLAIFWPSHIKPFFAGLTAPTTRDGCINEYVYPARTDIAARALVQSCNKQFISEAPLGGRDHCLRDGTLSGLTTETAARARIIECRNKFPEIVDPFANVDPE